MKTFLCGIACLCIGTWAGYGYAIRNNDILVMSIEWDKQSVETLERFSKLIEETDWCDK